MTSIHTLDGEPWVVAKDVCDALEINNTSKALERIDADEKGITSSYTPSGIQEMLIVNESGLYTLILGSRKKEAKEFKRWVTHEVIPAIRKTGAGFNGVNLRRYLRTFYPTTF